jgi:hypothetical protein
MGPAGGSAVPAVALGVADAATAGPSAPASYLKDARRWAPACSGTEARERRAHGTLARKRNHAKLPSIRATITPTRDHLPHLMSRSQGGDAGGRSSSSYDSSGNQRPSAGHRICVKWKPYLAALASHPFGTHRMRRANVRLTSTLDGRNVLTRLFMCSSKLESTSLTKALRIYTARASTVAFRSQASRTRLAAARLRS